MNWRIKGVVQKVLSAAPGGVGANDYLQRTIGGLRNFEAQVEVKLSDWSILMSHLGELGFPVTGARCLEIGTGWFPTLPVCFSLAGAAGCVTYDLSAHLSRRLTFKMLAALGDHLPAIADAASRPVGEVEAAYQRLRDGTTLRGVLREAGIDYRAPADATATGLPPWSVDVVFSNSVLEHVHPAAIAAMMRESSRVLRGGGVAVHSVNCGDHYAYFDPRITQINYLTYPAPAWRFWNNKLMYQNRLRPQDFLDSAEQAGLEVVLTKFQPRTELLGALPEMDIAPEFRHYPAEQLCCTSIDFVACKP